MGTCWSDNQILGDRYEVEKVYKSDGDAQFHRKQMNAEVEPEVTRNVRAAFGDGTARVEQHNTILTVQY